MKLLFTLSMPGCPSWNGRWSGEGRFYAVVRSFGKSRAAKARAEKILAGRSYYYRWPDGWAASIQVQEVDAAESRKALKRTNGFCGYDWMVDSILEKGRITTDHDEKQESKAALTTP